MEWRSAISTGPELDRVIDEVLSGLADAGGLGPDRPADLAFCFVGMEHRGGVEHLLERLAVGLGRPALLGCTASGVIAAGRELEYAPALAVLAGRLPGAAVHAFHLTEADLPDADASPRAWHEALGVSPADEPSFVVVPDPLTFPADRLLAGLDYAWPGAVTLGALASGATRPGAQALFLGPRVLRGGAVGVALMGDVALRPAVAQGCRPLGPSLVVTACDGPMLTGLDDTTALAALRRTLEDAARAGEGLEGRPLLVGVGVDPFTETEEGPWLVRPVLGMDARAEALVVGASLARGRRIRFHLRDKKTSHDDLERTLAGVDRAVGASPRAALLFSCVGRGTPLYGRPDHDSERLRARFGDLPIGGFFGHGEIGPVGRQTYLHGFTSAIALIERRADRSPTA